MATDIPATPTRRQRDPALEGLPTDPRRVRAFAAFFKSYMSIWTIVIAALPAPVTALQLIPTYEAHRYLLSVYTPLFCFLLLGFIFFSRHAIGRRLFFPRSVAAHTMGFRRWWSFRMSGLVAYAPMLLLCASFLLGMGYLSTLETSALIAKAEHRFHTLSNNGRELTSTEWREIKLSSIRYEQQLGIFGGGMLRGASQWFVASYADLPAEKPMVFSAWAHLRKAVSLEDIPLALTLKWRYLMIFLTAEAAFILMAIKEYLQDVLQISDVDLIRPEGGG